MASPPPRRPAVGIDLGTTNSVVAVYHNGRADTLTNAEGSRLTPSVVAFTPRTRLVGQSAVRQAASNPENTIFNVKRLIGRTKVASSITWLTKMTFGAISKSIDLVVKYKGCEQKYSPVEVSAMILEKIKETADFHLGGNVEQAVITVPAYFNDAQRKATKKAGKIAGLDVLRVINEPTAAAIAYGLHKNYSGMKRVIIIDLGGGTFDVSILKLKRNDYKVKSTSGDTELGGKDFTELLVKFVVNDIKKRYKRDILKEKRAIAVIREKCEEAKMFLSANVEATIDVYNFFGSDDYSITITQSQFNEITKDLVKRLISPIQEALAGAKMQKEDIDEIILVGGSTRIPKVQEAVSEFFGGRSLKSSIQPDEVVACGAAALAAHLCGEDVQDFQLQDVTPLSLGTDRHNGTLSVTIERNTPIPAYDESTWVTVYDDQTGMNFKIYEGERPIAKENHLLNEFELEGLTPLPKGEAKALLKCEIDADGILTVTAIDKLKGTTVQVTVSRGNYSAKDVERELETAEHFKLDDEKEKERLQAKTALQDYIYDMKKEIKIMDIGDNEKNEKLKDIENTESWISENPSALKAEIETMKSSLENGLGHEE